MSSKISAEAQKLEMDALVALYVLDLTELGGAVFRFHGEPTNNGAALSFGGQSFVAMPIEARGFAFSGTDQNPMPTLSVSNVNNVIPPLIREFEDLVGAKVTRIRTFRKHLDDGADPDATAKFSEEVFFVNRKLAENRISVDFELASIVDVDGVTLPMRRAIANLCPWVFKGAECGYSGPNATCAKTLAACKANFGSTAALPFGGFPGLSRTTFTS